MRRRLIIGALVAFIWEYAALAFALLDPLWLLHVGTWEVDSRGFLALEFPAVMALGAVLSLLFKEENLR